MQTARSIAQHTLLTGAWQVAGLTFAVSAVLALAALAGPGVLSVGVLAAALVLAWGWPGALALPSPRGSAAVLVVGGLAMVAGVALVRQPPWLQWLPAAVGISLIASFLHQLLRRDGRPRLVESVSGVCLGLAMLLAGALLVATARAEVVVVLAALAASAVSAAVGVLGRWPALRPWLVPGVMLAGGGAGVVLALWSEVPAAVLLVVGVGVGVVGHALRSVLSVLPTLAHLRPRLVSAIASVLFSGVVAYAVVRLAG